MTTNHVDPSRSQGTSPPRGYRSVTHGTCALDGKHESEAAAAECPILGRTKQERLQAWRERTNTNIAGTSKSSLPDRASPVESGTINVTIGVDEAYRKAHPRGRPRKHSTPRAAHTEAQRAYKVRRILTPEHKAAMQAGRRKAKARVDA